MRAWTNASADFRSSGFAAAAVASLVIFFKVTPIFSKLSTACRSDSSCGDSCPALVMLIAANKITTPPTFLGMAILTSRSGRLERPGDGLKRAFGIDDFCAKLFHGQLVSAIHVLRFLQFRIQFRLLLQQSDNCGA